MTEFHCIRPLWLFAFIPLLAWAWYSLRQSPAMTAWSNVCDKHLLPHLIQRKGHHRRMVSFGVLFLSLAFMIVSLSGPTWSRLPVPTYQNTQPRVLLLDMSEAMFEHDVSPDRLQRAKFKLHDLFQHQDAGQFGLVVYTSEPFVVAPLTEDGQTIDALLSSLTPDIMPVAGQELSHALEQAARLIAQAGFQHGELLVLTASPPSAEAIKVAKALSGMGVDTSIIPVIGHDTPMSPLFEQLVRAGKGELIPFSDTSKDLDQWLAATGGKKHYQASLQNDIPVWRDQGRWFLIPALLLLLPVFRRGWLQSVLS
jgi:Ca-activated chloride channel family protein